MVNYNSYKVSELKDLLKSHDLVVSGTKPELVARLQEFDAKNAEKATEPAAAAAPAETSAETGSETAAAATITAPEPAPAPAPASAPVVGTASVAILEETTDAAAANTTSEDAGDEKSEENEVETIVSDLTKRAARCEKFGATEEAADLRKQIDRIRKLGPGDYKASKSKGLRTVKDISASSVNKGNKHQIPEDVLAKRRAKFASST